MSNNNRYVRLSKTMSVALRHDPDSFGIELDKEGWVDVDKLLDANISAGRTSPKRTSIRS